MAAIPVFDEFGKYFIWAACLLQDFNCQTSLQAKTCSGALSASWVWSMSK